MKKQIIRFAIVLVMLITFLENNENVQAAKSVKIKLEKASVTLYVGEYTTIKPKLKNATKAQKEKAKYTYKSSNKSVAQVTKKGVLNAKKKGTAVITVTSNASKKQKATFKVVVKAKPKPAIEVPIENYYYAGLLRNMIEAPELFWSKSACDFNKAETNEFAIVDNNNDGEKELLVQYDDLTPGAWVRSIDIFQKDSLIKVLAFERTYSKYYQANTEFYRDGTIITQSDLDGYLYLVGYKNNVQIAEAYVWDKSLPENYYDGEFPAEYDKNGDGKVYVWRDYENGLQIREVYLTDEEYDKKIAGLTEGKEKLILNGKILRKQIYKKLLWGI